MGSCTRDPTRVLGSPVSYATQLLEWGPLKYAAILSNVGHAFGSHFGGPGTCQVLPRRQPETESWDTCT